MNKQPDTLTDPDKLTGLETEIIDFFVRSGQVIGLPKSIGEIYGLLYISMDPMSRDEIMQKLKISLGSASQGLRQLRSFRAVKTVYLPGHRKDYFTAETEFRKLVSGFLREEVFPHLESAEERLANLTPEKDLEESDSRLSHYRGRIDKLKRWHKLSAGILDKVVRLASI